MAQIANFHDGRHPEALHITFAWSRLGLSGSVESDWVHVKGAVTKRPRAVLLKVLVRVLPGLIGLGADV